MKVKHLTSKAYKTNHWSGGKTTELYIYPEGASYSKRQFLFRLSSATVEEAFSVFTKLEGVHRELILLKGEMKLIHEGKYEKQLKPYEKDHFSGEWQTTSYGVAKDFNLMVKAPMTGRMEVMKLEKKHLNYHMQREADNWLIEGFYSPEGSILLQLNGISYLLAQQDMLIIEKESQEEKLEVKIKALKNQRVPIIDIQLTKEV